MKEKYSIRKKDLQEIKNTHEVVNSLAPENTTKYDKDLFDFIFNNPNKVYKLKKMEKKDALKTMDALFEYFNAALDQYKQNPTKENLEKLEMCKTAYESFAKASVERALDNSDQQQR